MKKMLDDTGQSPMIKVKQEIIDGYFTGLTSCVSDDDKFQNKVIIHESDDSEEDDDDECDADQIEK